MDNDPQLLPPEPAPEVPAANSNPLDWSVLCDEARRFGVRKFRPGQRQIIEQVLAGRNVLGIMPTAADIAETAGLLAGERVRHVRFGQGAVLYSKGKRVRVAFDDPQKRRTVHAAYLQKVA